MSTWSQHAHSTASRAADSKPLEYLARAGFIGYGIVHLLFAWLALQIAVGDGAGEGDQSGALQSLAGKPFGAFLLVAICVGLVAMAVWQGLEAAVGHRHEEGKRRIAERVVSGVRAVIYLALAWTAFRVLQGAAASAADSQQQASQQLMSASGGRFLVGLIGLVVTGVGIGIGIYGARKKFERHLHTERMSAREHSVGRRLGMAGYVAKGIAYTIAGILVVVAAVTYDPSKARGLDAALRTLAEQPYGKYLLALVALGIAAFGVFCWFQARYRKV